MEGPLLSINKEMFVSIKKENINNFYEVVAKVTTLLSSNWEKELSGQFTRVELKGQKDLGEQ